ncbi:hypothetical protein [Pseudomonas sp.]|jgi:hypothetical protein|uniref:hypothetical protein n=1 Tax=Pseudomonas sp. TaxID=306 RepID=UPI0037CC9A37
MVALSTLSNLLRARPLLLTLASRFILVAALPIVAIALLFRLYYDPLMLEDINTRQGLAADNIARQLAACRTFLWFSAMIAACPQRDPA